MKISIYQVRISDDNRNIAFRDLKTVQSKYDGTVPAALYDRVYTCEVKTASLEEVYTIFNVDLPWDYRARSMTQSDVVEVYNDDGISQFYFCDTYRFVPVTFDKSLSRDGDGR